MAFSHSLNFYVIQQQDESTQRYQEGLKHIREKAFEMSVLRHSTEDHNDAPQLTPYDKKKMCTICNTLVSKVYKNLTLVCGTDKSFEPRSEKTGLRGFRPGPTQTGLYSHKR